MQTCVYVRANSVNVLSQSRFVRLNAAVGSQLWCRTLLRYRWSSGGRRSCASNFLVSQSDLKLIISQVDKLTCSLAYFESVRCQKESFNMRTWEAPALKLTLNGTFSALEFRLTFLNHFKRKLIGNQLHFIKNLHMFQPRTVYVKKFQEGIENGFGFVRQQIGHRIKALGMRWLRRQNAADFFGTSNIKGFVYS